MNKAELEKVVNKYVKKQDTYNIVFAWLVILSLFLSALSLGLVLSIPAPLKGDKGDVGDQGIQGIQGVKGEQGLQGLQGDKGDKGDDGARGPVGASGSSGRNGVDCKPNQKPVITLIDINGTRIFKCTMFTFWLNVSVTDPDDDALQIDFFYSEEANGSFIHHDTFFGVGGCYNSSVVFEYPYLVEHKTIYFQVVAWDGSDIALGCFEVVV